MKALTFYDVRERYNALYHIFADPLQIYGWQRENNERCEENEAARVTLLELLDKLKNEVPDSEYIQSDYNPLWGQLGYAFHLYRVDDCLRGGHYANACSETVNILAFEPFLQMRIKNNLVHTLEKYLL